MNRNRIIAGICLVGLIVSFSIIRSTSAADGDLDSTFGTGGKFVTSIDTKSGTPTRMALQPDGKTVVATTFLDGTDDKFRVTRINTDGTLDTTFGGTGIVTTNVVNNNQEQVGGIDVQSDGKIVVAGWAISNNWYFATVRYNNDGTLDNTFDNDGLLLTASSERTIKAFAVDIQPDQKIVVAGFGYTNSIESHVYVLRYNSDGTPDTNFGGAGAIAIPVAANAYHSFHSVLVQSDGSILTGFMFWNGARQCPAFIRVTPAGGLDSTFDLDGRLSTDFGRDFRAESLAQQTDGKFIVGGYHHTVSFGWVFAAARYNLDGSLDSTFDGDGLATPLGFFSQSFAMALQSDGRIFLAGYALGEAITNDFCIARLNTDGSIDGSWGTGGVVKTHFGGHESANAIVIQSDGKAIAAGSGTGNQLYMVRYASGGPPPSPTPTPVPTPTPTVTPTPTPTPVPLYSISGTAVYRRPTSIRSRKISGVLVTLRDLNGNLIRSDTTDSRGAYVLSNLPAGDYVLEANHPQYIFINNPWPAPVPLLQVFTIVSFERR